MNMLIFSTGVWIADSFGATCVQTVNPEFVLMEEDCLYLNIWRPTEFIENRAVMVSINLCLLVNLFQSLAKA